MRRRFATLLLLAGLAAAGPAAAQWGYGPRGGGYGPPERGYGPPDRGYGPPDGYGPGPVGGSFRRTCTQVEQRGPWLRALCRDRWGDYVQASADTRRCGRFGNRDGRLVCEGSSPRYAPPPSYGGDDED